MPLFTFVYKQKYILFASLVLSFFNLPKIV